jgi:hypothetical protein
MTTKQFTKADYDAGVREVFTRKEKIKLTVLGHFPTFYNKDYPFLMIDNTNGSCYRYTEDGQFVCGQDSHENDAMIEVAKLWIDNFLRIVEKMADRPDSNNQYTYFSDIHSKCEQEKPLTHDPVNHPSHYTSGKIEVYDFIEDQKLDFPSGNAVKYICRAGKKDPSKEVEDLEKAIWYLTRKIKNLGKSVHP